MRVILVKGVVDPMVRKVRYAGNTLELTIPDKLCSSVPDTTALPPHDYWATVMD